MSAQSVAALYIDPLGPYASMGDVDCWPLERDARLYAGPLPVVAHPPCGPWGRLRFLCTKQDPTCGPIAVEQVRALGGVLEHPAQSTLWRRCRMPWPGELPDEWGGRTYEVQQVAWGHCCVKPTWLYVVRVAPEIVIAGMRSGGTATHRITSGPRGPRLPSASKRKGARTPPSFARWLISLARASSGETAYAGV